MLWKCAQKYDGAHGIFVSSKIQALKPFSQTRDLCRSFFRPESPRMPICPIKEKELFWRKNTQINKHIYTYCSLKELRYSGTVEGLLG